jgi:hypothetical protein
VIKAISDAQTYKILFFSYFPWSIIALIVSQLAYGSALHYGTQLMISSPLFVFEILWLNSSGFVSELLKNRATKRDR